MSEFFDEYEECEYIDTSIHFVETNIPTKILDMKYQLREIAEKEATKLFRFAWNMEKHGCSLESIRTCQKEAWRLYSEITAYPERLWDSSIHWEYAFKWGY